MRFLTMLVTLGFTAVAYAATPTVNKVTGTVSSGQILTITGKNMVQENTSHWLPRFKHENAYGFEGSDPRADGYCSAGYCKGRYDSSVKLSGNQSAYFHVVGASAPYPHYIESFNGISLYSQNFYGRTYFRYTNNSGVWPDNALKFIDIQGTTNAVYIQPVGSVTPPDTFRVVDNGQNYYGAIPGGAIKTDRWYLLEWQYSSANAQVKVWIDNRLIITAPLTVTTQNYLEYGIVNAFSTPSNFALDLRMDNMAMSTTRVYPSSLIEISNNATYGHGTVTYQEPVYLSDGSILIKADLTGLGSGPYYLWVTNNGQARSAPYKLSGGRGNSTKTPIANGTILFRENFADANFASRGWYDNTTLTVSTTEYAPGSTSSARFSFAAGATTPSSGGAMRKLFTATDSVYVSYWEKYSSNWQDQTGGDGHHEIYLLTNQDDAYTNLAFTHLTSYLETWGTAVSSRINLNSWGRIFSE